MGHRWKHGAQVEVQVTGGSTGHMVLWVTEESTGTCCSMGHRWKYRSHVVWVTGGNTEVTYDSNRRFYTKLVYK